MIVIGGTYRERSLHPNIDQLAGSGLRAGRAHATTLDGAPETRKIQKRLFRSNAPPRPRREIVGLRGLRCSLDIIVIQLVLLRFVVTFSNGHSVIGAG